MPKRRHGGQTRANGPMSDTFADATGERAQESEPICIHQLLKIICALWVAGAALLSLVGRAFHRRAIPNMKWAKSLQKATVQNKLLWNECPIKSLAQPMPAHIYQQSHRLLADIGGIHHIACARNGAIEVWNLRTCQQIFTLGQGAKSPYRLSFIECNGIPHLAGALEEGKLLVWNLNTGNLVHSIDVGQPIYAVVTSHSTRLVTQGKFNSGFLWSRTFEPSQVF